MRRSESITPKIVMDRIIAWKVASSDHERTAARSRRPDDGRASFDVRQGSVVSAALI
jgi:hypothetical protein